MEDAHLYIRANPMQTKDAEETLMEFSGIFKWTQNEKVLDIGCGPGDVTSNILKTFIPDDATLVGGDVSSEMVTFATSKFQSSQLMFRTLDIENISGEYWEKESFDKIFSFYCFHWIRNQGFVMNHHFNSFYFNSLALKNMYTLLKPEGQLFLVFLARVPVFELYKCLSKEEKWAPFMNDVDEYICKYHKMDKPAEDFQRSLLENNFKNVHVKNELKSFSYSSVEQLVTSIVAVNPFIKRIPPHLLPSYKNDIERHALKMTNQRGELLEVNYTLIVAYAVK